MKVNAKSYPHPVLGNGDDIKGGFDPEFTYQLGRDEIVLTIGFNLKNAGIASLIKKGRASFVVEVQCPSTFYRASFATRNDVHQINIPPKLLRERVTVGFFICADEAIAKYRPVDCHPDYAGASFDIEVGDMLATGGYSGFLADKDFDPMRPPVFSLIRINVGRHHEGPYDVDYGSEKITIELSKADWRKYLEISKEKDAIPSLHAAIVLPVLVDAIQKVKNGNGQYENMSWYGRLQTILETKGVDDKEPLEAAQRILDNPSSRYFESVAKMLEVTPEEDHE